MWSEDTREDTREDSREGAGRELLPNCGAQVEPGVTFCPECGAAIPVSKTEKKTMRESKPAGEKKPIPPKALLFGGVGLLAVAVVILLVVLLAGGKSGKGSVNYAFYVKDDEIIYTSLKKDSEPWTVTTRLLDDENADDDFLANATYSLSLMTYLTPDGKYIFFPDKVTEDDYGINLYYRDAKDRKAQPVKVDSDVVCYAVNSACTLVTYLKGEDNNLYQYKIKENTKDKIAGDVSDFRVSDDGKKIVWSDDENDLYVKYSDKDKEKLASDVTNMVYVSDDLTTFYFTREDVLYKITEGKEREKIASDVYNVVRVYESGEIYYIKGAYKDVPLADFVNDDMKNSDAAITEPQYPTYPSEPSCPRWYDYDTDEEYQAAYNDYLEKYEAYEAECDRIDEEYDAAWDAYWDKDNRDDLREDLQDETINWPEFTLCYYDGAEEKVVSDSMRRGYIDAYAQDAAVVCYSAAAEAEKPTIKISEVDSIYDVQSFVYDAQYDSDEQVIAIKDVSTALKEQKSITGLCVNPAGTEILYIDDIPDEKSYGELYRVTISRGAAGEPEKYDSDVYASYVYYTVDGRPVYFKDYKDGKAELYISKTRVDYDVRLYSLSVDSRNGKVYYYTDWNSDKSDGTLKVYDGKETVKISDDVALFTTLPDGRVLYLYDYSFSRYTGELYEWSKGEANKLQDDVTTVFYYTESKYRGNLYYNW